MFVTWYKSEKNWGDALNPILIENISNIKPDWIDKNKQSNTEVYYVIGSILQWVKFKNTTVWGSGFISDDRRLSIEPKICAVRGPLTRDIILSQNMKCPEIYGDPALLYPRFYNPKIDKKYKLGIIPHYIDADNQLLEQFKNNPDILIIDITSDINTVVKNIKSCEKIASSTLHGIIASDSYGIPSIWVEFSNKVIGNGFKFRDYFLSVKRNDLLPLVINNNTKISDIYNKFKSYEIDIDLDLLYNSCPFKKIS